MLKNIINEFRQRNGQHSVSIGDELENEHCLYHCKYMASVQNCFHAPEHLLYGKSEAVGYCYFFRDPLEALGVIIFDQFSNSMGHRNILLFSRHLACAFHVDHESKLVFVTVRGW